MANDKIQPGDIVRLKSGSESMTVGFIETVVGVEWCDNDGQILKAEILLDSLEKIKPQGT